MALGMYELSFNKISKFIYQISQIEGGVSRDNFCFFVRQVKWQKLMRGISGQLKVIKDQFLNKVLLDYLEKVYLPIKQDKVIKIMTILHQREKAMKEIRRRKRISNDLSIQSDNNLKKRRESDLDVQIQNRFNLHLLNNQEDEEHFFRDSLDSDTNLINAMDKTKKYIEGLKSKYRFLSDPQVEMYFDRIGALEVLEKEKQEVKAELFKGKR